MKKLIALSMILVCLGFFSLGCEGGGSKTPTPANPPAEGGTDTAPAAPGTTEAPAK